MTSIQAIVKMKLVYMSEQVGDIKTIPIHFAFEVKEKGYYPEYDQHGVPTGVYFVGEDETYRIIDECLVSVFVSEEKEWAMRLLEGEMSRADNEALIRRIPYNEIKKYFDEACLYPYVPSEGYVKGGKVNRMLKYGEDGK